MMNYVTCRVISPEKFTEPCRLVGVHIKEQLPVRKDKILA